MINVQGILQSERSQSLYCFLLGPFGKG